MIAKPKVLIFPARISPNYFFSLFDGENQPGQRVFFLFSVRQVEDIIADLRVYPVPFSRSHIEGISEWRGHVAPVISLEEWLGLHPEEAEPPGPARLISLRTLGNMAGRIIIRTGGEIRMMPVPVSSVPDPSAVTWVPRKECVRGVYEWAEGYLLVIA